MGMSSETVLRANIEEWLVVIDNGAGLGIGSQILLQPLVLCGTGPTGILGGLRSG